MASKTPGDILVDIDELLKESSWKGPPSDLSHLADPDHLQEFSEMVLGGEQDKKTMEWILKQVEQSMKVALGKTSFQVCSVGCGDGALDKQVLEELAAAHPTTEIQYVGVGLCEQGCEEVEAKMEGLAGNVMVQVVAKDYSELSKEEVGTFDCVLMVGCLGYSPAPEATLKAILELVKPEGELIVVSSSHQSVDALIARFWKHQRQYDLCTTENIKEILESLGVKHKMTRLPGVFNLTRCFAANFETVSSRHILDHIVQVNMEEYSPAICDACIEYLEALSVGPAEKRVVQSHSDMIVIRGK